MPSAIYIPRAAKGARRAFTLVELLVVLVIVMLLSALTLAGLAVAGRNAKIDRTKNTIRKIHEIVMPHYESYLRRRIPPPNITTSGSENAVNRLVALRQLMVYEMPDSWNDVRDKVDDVEDGQNPKTGPIFGYAQTKGALKPTPENGGAECLYMIVSRGIGESDAMEQFRAEEVGDVDKDQAPEFLDAWGAPIEFIRWAPGFTDLSPVQKNNPTMLHDPFDPMRVDPGAYALVPLIVSGGPDRSIGLELSNGYQPAQRLELQYVIDNKDYRDRNPGRIKTPSESPNTYVDNITNHDLMKK